MIESLCENCRNMREVKTPKGSRFLLCQLSATDSVYAKYPPQPIIQCRGYEQDEAKVAITLRRDEPSTNDIQRP